MSCPNPQEFWMPLDPSPETSVNWRYKELDPITAIERQYLGVMNAILDKPQWWAKLKDPEIQQKWRQESGLGEAAFGLLLQELACYARDFIQSKEWPNVSPIPAHGVYISDLSISPELRQRLLEHAAPLEQEALVEGRWHPGSKGIVLDLVHPSPHCLTFGKSRFSKNPQALTGTETIHWQGTPDTRRDISAKYQWLPAEFEIDADGHVSIASYINNLHPELHKALYGDIERIFEAMLPMFELTVDSLNSSPRNRIDVDYGKLFDHDLYDWRRHMWKEHRQQLRKAQAVEAARVGDDGQPTTDHGHSNDDDGEDGDEKWDWMYALEDTRELHVPQLPEKFEPDVPSPARFRARSVQAIVKLATIHLTPENPRYDGGSWHMEGMENEAIAATGIYYYDMENITDSVLRFRHAFDSMAFEYDQGDHRGILEVFDVENDTEALMEQGQLTALPGRCATFPNFLHHQVQPFELADKTKPGFRKVLCFFLIHPRNHIISTRQVPPQQRSWLRHALYRLLRPRLPELCIDRIQYYLDCDMSMQDAYAHSEKVMDERKAANRDRDYEYVSLCEH
ncbi:uncharacterized protein BJ171DRAFT_513780 [Polychytrium aggregatum]|uniref:uncharacterized protein n=1 Tax=Polychytrium aggregatum TaxID=110093 RepID=UPI0022FE552F|nr:uncharacterized protein BJ171DRAFT_513780 [Polychytrium aggregatum]KAI9202613.1 hypothetical protein BJ171DRAFT_513780 [Polychytrium aggregatum]